ncbi:hypothetical protein F8388_007405 [Cannabis sativa]|uniref:Orn/Lys/Arg decarboxylases family 1 pyridoxal-P attachment site domain-containing protein n=1 Tax=Cannabis sativa TaxID=3483 RepID=A0A7J6F4C5_CANSA|nr:hypothetical protein F8388_007405 [Cannabis sativa]
MNDDLGLLHSPSSPFLEDLNASCGLSQAVASANSSFDISGMYSFILCFSRNGQFIPTTTGYLGENIVESSKKQDMTSHIRNQNKFRIENIEISKQQQYNLPPLVSAVKKKSSTKCCNFPLSRGRGAPFSLTQLIGLEPFIHDLAAISELDNLTSPHGLILEAQKEAVKLFGALETWFLVGGTTCGIHAAIMATCSPGDISGMVLSGAVLKYIIPEYDVEWDIAGGVIPSQHYYQMNNNSKLILAHFKEYYQKSEDFENTVRNLPIELNEEQW